MTPTITDIDEYVMEASAASALREMIDDGFKVTHEMLKNRIKELNAKGIRQWHGYDKQRNTGFASDMIFQTEAEIGCERLLEAQKRAGQVMPVPMRAWHLRHVAC